MDDPCDLFTTNQNRLFNIQTKPGPLNLIHWMPHIPTKLIVYSICANPPLPLAVYHLHHRWRWYHIYTTTKATNQIPFLITTTHWALSYSRFLWSFLLHHHRIHLPQPSSSRSHWYVTTTNLSNQWIWIRYLLHFFMCVNVLFLSISHVRAQMSSKASSSCDFLVFVCVNLLCFVFRCYINMLYRVFYIYKSSRSLKPSISSYHSHRFSTFSVSKTIHPYYTLNSIIS